MLTLILTFSLAIPANAALINPEWLVPSTTEPTSFSDDWSDVESAPVYDYLSGNTLYLPSGWEHDFDEETSDTMVKVHLLPKDSSITIKYQNVDYWSLMQEEYQKNCPRSEINNDAIPKERIAELVGVDTKDIALVLVDGIEYFYIIKKSSITSFGYTFTRTNIFLIRFHDGYFYTYSFGADDDHSLYDDFIGIVASATYGESIDNMGGTYRGELQNGKPHGEGTLTLSEGTYTGSFVNGYPKGTGVFTYSNGKSVKGDNWSYGSIYVDLLMADYSGMLLDGKPAGYGTLYFDYGAQYTGTFRNEYPYGQGEYIASTSKKTSGHWEWVEDVYDSWVPDRQGADMYYTGMTCNNKFCGYGSLTFLSGGQFLGEFAKGDPNGWGIYAYRSPSTESDRYMYGTAWATVNGEYRLEHTYYGLKLEDKWQGFGIGIKKSGYAYCGEILDDYRDGHGELYTPKDKLEEWGIYRRGKIKEKYSLS